MRASVFRNTLLCGAATAALGLATTNTARAAGFALREGSADWMANAFAGETAKAYDASTAWSNPAGMVRLDDSEVDASVNGIFPTMNFSGSTPGISGSDGNNLISAAATAGFYGVWSVNPDFKLGFAADSPFGQRVANPTDFVGRYQSLVSSITDMEFLISAAYKINNQWSIGGGPVLDYFQARLTQALGPYPPATTYGMGDPDADLHGSNVAVGANIGIMYQPTQDLRFGLDYRSRITQSIDGTQAVSTPSAYSLLLPATGPLIAGLAAQNSAAKTSITLPDNVALGAYWQATPQLALMADLGWTDWSLLKNIVITPTSPYAASSTIPENWRDTWSIAVGANYRVLPKLLLQGGLGYDQSPVTASNRTSRIPDADRYLVGIGAQYEVLPNLTVQAAYAHVFFASAPIDSPIATPGGAVTALVGKYSDSADTVSLGMKYRF